jgi:Family of unknown function (DUF5906)
MSLLPPPPALTADTRANHDAALEYLLHYYVYLPATRGRGQAISVGERGPYPIALASLRDMWGAYCWEEEGPRGGIRKHHPVNAWALQAARVAGVQCRPDIAKRVFADPIDNRLYVNTWHAPVHPAKGGSIKLFTDFVTGLIPDNHEHFLDQLACKLQHPETRGIATVLVAHKRQGTGRGMLFDIVALLLGQAYTTTVAFSELFSPFNEHLAKLIVMINETRGAVDDYRSTKRQEMMEALKQQVDPKPQRHVVNYKFGLKNEVQVLTWYLFATNHLDALPIRYEDRRFNILRCGEKRDPVFYRELAAWTAEPANIGALYRWLLKRDISRHDPHQYIDTDIREQMRDASTSDVEEAIENVLGALPGRVMQIHQVMRMIEVNIRETGFVTAQWQWPARRQLSSDLVRVVRPKDGAKVKKVYARTEFDAHQWATADRTMIERQLQLNEEALAKVGAVRHGHFTWEHLVDPTTEKGEDDDA